jgi:hypothetical protein
LIETAQQLEDAVEVDADYRRDRLGLSARIHHLAATTMMKFGEVDLAWIAAERAIRAGDSSGDPLALASASRAGTLALLGLGRYHEALELGTTAIAYLRERVSDGRAGRCSPRCAAPGRARGPGNRSAQRGCPGDGT